MDDPVTIWLHRLRDVDGDAADGLWNHYCSRLRALARSRLPAATRRVYDEDDAAVSAFFSLCRGLRDGKFSAVSDRDDLWRLLVVITARKVSHRIRDDGRKKRGGRHPVVSIFADSSQSGGVIEIEGREPTPEFAAEVVETCDMLFEQLPEDMMREIASKKMEGFSNAEIAEDLRIGKRTVERKLNLIRHIWDQSISQTPSGESSKNDEPGRT